MVVKKRIKLKAKQISVSPKSMVVETKQISMISVISPKSMAVKTKQILVTSVVSPKIMVDKAKQISVI